jgi:accessory colonization factor AcfC
VKNLEKKYPEIDFISVNIDKISTDNWLNKLKINADSYSCTNCKNKLSANEFKLRNADIAKRLLGIQYIRKTIIVDSKMNIIESNVNLFSDNFDEILN